MKNQNSLIILDRDGVLNKLLVLPNGETDSPLNIFEISVFHWVSDCLKELNSLGFGLAIATNQPAAAKSKISYEKLYDIHNYIVQQAQSDGAKILSSHICIHRKEDLCECRKPKTGLLKEAFDTHPQFNLENSWMVGDRATDIIAGHNFKLQTAWLGTPSQEDEDLLKKHNIVPSFRGNDLRDFVYYLKTNSIIRFAAINNETDEIVYLEMEESAFLEWEEAIKKEHDELKARRKEADKIDRDAWRYCRDDD